MKLLVHRITRALHDASNRGVWHDLPTFLEIVDVSGDAETFVWPNEFPSRCMLDTQNNIIANPAWHPPTPSALAQALDNALADPALNLAKLKVVLQEWRKQV